MNGLILASPTSGAGKTTVVLGLLRALTEAGVRARGAKSGPDYIDPQFHAAACGHPCHNLDAWAMPPEMLRNLARVGTPELLLIEGAMGLFDGAPPAGKGATADLARLLRLPVVLVVDAKRIAHSIAPLVNGFMRFDPTVEVRGVILNRVGSPRHKDMLETALKPLGIPVLGAVPDLQKLAHPDRHLGLVQASERDDLEAYLARAGDLMSLHIDLGALQELAEPLPKRSTETAVAMPPLGQRIAVARDIAFTFTYPHILEGWRKRGAQIIPFSPLADEPVPEADFVYLPGGYPELHVGRLAQNAVFLHSLRRAAETAQIYGECGGYMVLGKTLTDAAGTRYEMAGLLELETSFAARRLHLGYRHLHSFEGPLAGRWTGHEFHYATTIKAEGTPLFEAAQASGEKLAPMGLRMGSVCGSFAHLIARA